MRYIVIDADGLIINAIEWDGVTEWAPPEGCTAVKLEAGSSGEFEAGSSGDSYINGVVIPAPVPEPLPVAPTFEQLIAQASTFDELKALVLAHGNWS